MHQSNPEEPLESKQTNTTDQAIPDQVRDPAESGEQEAVKILQKEVQELRDRNLRLLAEMENLRKRLAKESQESTRFALEDFACDFLNPIDNMENALRCAGQMSPEVKNWAIGFQMILDQFKETLSQRGIAPYNSEGETFDPHLHEAVEIEETDRLPEGTIVKEFARGYRSGTRIVRPAKVKVAKLKISGDSLKEEKSDV